MYKKLMSKVDELQIAYAGLMIHLFTASEVSTETESLLNKCFFLQHNLAGQFEMLGMDRCAYHSRVLETRLALFPPIHRQYPLHELSSEASQQIEQLWASPQMLYQLITSYRQHMLKETLPLPTFATRDPDSCAQASSTCLKICFHYCISKHHHLKVCNRHDFVLFFMKSLLCTTFMTVALMSVAHLALWHKTHCSSRSVPPSIQQQ